MHTVNRLGAVALVVLTFGIAPAQAQNTRVQFDSAQKTVSVDTDSADVRQVVSLLFKEAGGAKFEIAHGVNGKVTLHRRGMNPESALREVLRQVGATWRSERRADGFYYVIIPIGDLPKPQDVPEAFRVMVEVNAQDRPIGAVTKALTNRTGIAIKYDRTVPNDLRVTCVASREPFWTVMQRLAIAARLKVEITGPKEVTLRPLASVYVSRRGDPVGGVVEEYGTCRQCRFHELKSGWRFCPMCGERIRER